MRISNFLPAATLACMFLGLAADARAGIDRVTRLTADPVQYGLVEYQLAVTAPWSDPYRAADIRLELEDTAASGARLVLPGYFERGASGASSVWRVRWAPREAGAHRLRFVLRAAGAADAVAADEVEVAAARTPGFLHVDGPWRLRFDDGTPFRALGENLCWEARSNDDSRHFKALHENARFNYDYLFGRLHALGGNFARVWMCPWNLPLEWARPVDTDRYRDSRERFNASAAERLDAVLARAEATGVYVMLCLEPAGALGGGLWERNSYNAANGGPCARPETFFTDPAARERFRDRLRYLVARWGWSPHVAVWELFNEVDNALFAFAPAAQSPVAVVAWHDEMAAYLKAIDPYGRPVTTSTSHRDIPGLEQVPAFDFIQRHPYKRTAAIPAIVREAGAKSGKPCVVGEFSYEWDWSKDFNEFAPAMDRDLRDGLWSGLFSPTPILPLTWWWEFFDERGTIGCLADVRAVLNEMLRVGQGAFADGRANWSGGAVEVLAVACGPAQFVLVRNAAAEPRSGTLQVTGSPDGLRRYDPATHGWRAQPAAAGGASLTLAPGEFVVLESGAR